LKRSFSPALVLCLPALAGALGLAWSLSTYGPSMSQTGLHNVAAAESLLSGAPLETSRGELFTLWPPLMPLVFAAGARLGFEFADVALVGNVLACFVLLFGVGYLAWMASGSLLASLLAQGFLMAVPPLFRSMATIQTEPWFLALVVAGALTAVLHLETQRTGWLVASACCLALARDRCVQALLEVDEGIRTPQPPAQFLARDHLLVILKQDPEDLERLPAEADPGPVLPDLPSLPVEFESAEPNRPFPAVRVCHHVLLEPSVHVAP
jgi:hypothetical protein